MTLRTFAVLSIALTSFGFCYLPDVGHGFLRDDFAWLRQYEIHSANDIALAFAKDNGFYRPVVGLSFGVQRLISGPNPFVFGLSNLLLVVTTAASLAWLVRSLGMSRAAAAFAAFAWAFNPHGIPMSVLWISGRTALFLCVFAVLAVVAAIKRHPALVFVASLAAMLSKEEAVVLPAILLAWCVVLRPEWSARSTWKISLRVAMPAAVALGVYLFLRFPTAAMLPQSATESYRFSAGPWLLARNAVEYVDRAATFSAALLVLGCLAVWRRPRMERSELRLVLFGLLWTALGYSLTVFIPVRSSLYACFPSLGVTLAGAATAQALWRSTPDASRWRLLVSVAVVALVMIPVQRKRAVRWVRPADVSQRVIAELAALPHARGAYIVLHDADGDGSTLARSFATMFPDAVRVFLNDPDIRGRLTPPAPGEVAASVQAPLDGQVIENFAFRSGHLRRFEPGRVNPRS